MSIDWLPSKGKWKQDPDQSHSGAGIGSHHIPLGMECCPNESVSAGWEDRAMIYMDWITVLGVHGCEVEVYTSLTTH